MNPDPSLVFAYKTDSGLFDAVTTIGHKIFSAAATTTCADLDALQDLIRKRYDYPG